MAEEEKIVHHAKEAVHALTNKEKKWKEKVKDFLLEIFIIIIAVSITLWFHNWNDRKHEREQEKNFLIGIRNDLSKDTIAMNNDIKYFQSTLDYYDTVWLQIFRNKINSDYVNSNSGFLINTLYLTFDYSLFENFKNSGNLKLIYNQKLLRDITELYSFLMPFYQNMDAERFNKRRDNYAKNIGNVAIVDSFGKPNIVPLLGKPNVRYELLDDIVFFKERKKHIKEIISQMSFVVKEIDTELKDRFDYDIADKK